MADSRFIIISFRLSKVYLQDLEFMIFKAPL